MKHYVLVKIVKKSYLIFLFSIFIGCNEHLTSEEDLYSNSFDKIAANKTEEEVVNKSNLKIIKSAKGKYKVGTVKMATKNIKELAKTYEGYISDLYFKNNSYTIENRFTVKIPKEYFDVFLDSIRNQIEFIDYENITTRDVTEEYFDAESRLKTKSEVKERYEEILRKKAKTVDDVLKTEEKLRIIQEEIEVTKGKLKYLKNRISYSTINIEVYEAAHYKPKAFFTKIIEGLINGSNIISSLILGILNILPIFLLAISAFIIYKRTRKK